MEELIEFLPELIEQFGVESTLIFLAVFTVYQMYSPDFLPESKGQKFIRRLLGLVASLNSPNGSDEGTPTTNDGGDGNKTNSRTDESHPTTQVTGSDEVRNGERHG